MDVIYSYFPELSALQRKQLSQLPELFSHWNSQINVVSRKDIDNLTIHHILHSMAIAKAISFAKGTRIVDVGTGGGFPGIPLAIMFPTSTFMLVDSIGKKVTVAEAIAKSIGLTNVEVKHSRVEALTETYDFAVTRGVAPVPKLMGWTEKCIKPGGYNNLPNGVFALKGGDVSAEIRPFGRRVTRWRIANFFQEDFFEEKLLLHISR